ncbi:hypothetical protein CXB51_022187 [Gossypium anomalum]|uniref:Uncharacterized protein n=1 Tax=Gossypium anomalum TaxID=47600 RepID=A0A8J6CX50_9ROSI|nr:hypothetical protein CXB51_022187 [Gossypium anomalum]
METMNKRFSRVSLGAVLLVLIAVQVNGFFPFDYESEFAQSSLDFQNFPSNSDENSLFSESQVYEPQSQYFHTESNHHLHHRHHHLSKCHHPAPSPVEVPSPAPSPVEAPHPPKPNPVNICKLKCSTKCLKQEIPILHNLCCRVCKLRCLYHYADLIYTCTNRCANPCPIPSNLIRLTSILMTVEINISLKPPLRNSDRLRKWKELINDLIRFSSVSLVTIVLVLIAVQVNCFFPFDYESGLLKISMKIHCFQNLKFMSPNPITFTRTSLLSQSDLPHDSFETQQLPFEINPNHRIKSPAPSPLEVSSPVQVPSPALSPVEAPHPPKPNPDNTCKLKCSTKCLKQDIPILHNLCNKVCKLRCLYHYADLIYSCTDRCAESMPNKFKSDKKKEAAYVKYCYKKCIKISNYVFRLNL